MNEEKIEYLPLDKIEAAPQVRTEFDPDSLRGLSDSLLAVGQLQPIRVRREGDVFVVVDGERRLRAAKMAGLTSLAAIIEENELDAAAVLQRQLIANCQRDDLSPIEQSQAIKAILAQTGGSAADVASELGFTRGTVAKLLALVDLPESIQAQIRDGKIPATAGYELSRVTDAGEQGVLADKLASGDLTRDGLSGIVKRRRTAQSTDKAEHSTRVRVELSAGRSITLAGAGLNGLDAMIGWLEELLGKARKLRPKGLSLATMIKILKEEARA